MSGLGIEGLAPGFTGAGSGLQAQPETAFKELIVRRTILAMKACIVITEGRGKATGQTWRRQR
ncbi:hypothetical protein BKI51_06415 [Alphaproteobacteria bacterium AO1-B]|nr:hypothetical protein BKI51_06415 [Alphaproteobacteria bacterium AO1-B]